ncbi:hypothetical protein HYE05_04195 [Mycoplasmopsis bovis]|nr:hypothetical protein HYE05_04195 [Mycoplasmopsis bovis]
MNMTSVVRMYNKIFGKINFLILSITNELSLYKDRLKPKIFLVLWWITADIYTKFWSTSIGEGMYVTSVA